MKKWDIILLIISLLFLAFGFGSLALEWAILWFLFVVIWILVYILYIYDLIKNDEAHFWDDFEKNFFDEEKLKKYKKLSKKEIDKNL